MSIKIDLEKAYDRIKWSFVRNMLIDIRFPNDFVNLVWQCISSPSLKIVWNGEASDSFTPLCGIRQKGPFYSYLFILCIKRLS